MIRFLFVEPFGRIYPTWKAEISQLFNSNETQKHFQNVLQFQSTYFEWSIFGTRSLYMAHTTTWGVLTELGGMHCEGGLFTDKKLAPCINEQELSTAFKNSRKGIKGSVALTNASFSLGLHSSTGFQCSLLSEALTEDVCLKIKQTCLKWSKIWSEINSKF